VRMEMNYFDVKRVEFGRPTTFANGLLTIDKDGLAASLPRDLAISSIEITVAHPGERVRIANILDITEPRVKETIDHYYPGMLGPVYRAGVGRTNALRGAAILEIGAVEGLSGGLVDMAGTGARLTIHSETANICVCAEPAPGARLVDYCRALKQAALTASVQLAKTTKGLKGDDKEVFDLERPRGRLDGLPRVACLIQLHSHGEIREPFIYGANTRSYYPTILHPNEILDGALVCGHYNISPAIKNTTYTLLNHPVIRGLFRRHGTELDFRGVVIAPEPTSLTEIARTSMLASGLLKNALQADGVIITKEGGGHTDVDLMENCNACEYLGIKTVLIDNEWLGPDGAGEFPLLASSSNADAMISVGNADAVVRLAPMDRVIGGSKLTGGSFDQDLEGDISLPVWFIPNAISQAGFTYLSAAAR
jgi:glycine reductase complex component B subunit alpha and beta